MTGNRVTIMVDDELDKRVRSQQAKMIREISGSYSYSRTLNDIVEIGLKKRNAGENKTKSSGGKRVTVMMDKELDRQIKLRYAKHIEKCANDYCEMPSWSYSRQVNLLLKLGFGIKP
jgi:hypothetical protein